MAITSCMQKDSELFLFVGSYADATDPGINLFRFDPLQIRSDVGALRFWDNALRFDKAFSLRLVSESRRQIFLWLIAIH